MVTNPIRPTSKEPQSLTWNDFLASFDWRQGEHVTIVGPIGQGKTHLAREILKLRTYPIVIATKPRDELLKTFRGYQVIRSMPLPPPQYVAPRLLFWPKNEKPSDIPKQKEQIKALCLYVYQTGNYAVCFDELNYVTEYLNLRSLVELLIRQGRSIGISLVMLTQRPFNIPLLAYDQSTHLFFFRENDDVNLRRLGSFGNVANRDVRAIVATLEQHQVLYLNTRTGRLVLTKAPP